MAKPISAGPKRQIADYPMQNLRHAAAKVFFKPQMLPATYYREYHNRNDQSPQQPPLNQIRKQTHQPIGYVAPMHRIPGVPLGLEHLIGVGKLLIKQKFEGIEVLTGLESNNVYSILNSCHQELMVAKENTNFCKRYWCGPNRCFNIQIMDIFGGQVMNLHRPYRCSSCFRGWCLQKVEASTPTGETIGYVTQDWSICRPYFSIRNAEKNVLLRIRGPRWRCRLGRDVKFDIISTETNRIIGQLIKQWAGVVQEAISDADNYALTFPVDLHLNVKATLLAAVFLIDFMYFEDDVLNKHF